MILSDELLQIEKESTYIIQLIILKLRLWFWIISNRWTPIFIISVHLCSFANEWSLVGSDEGGIYYVTLKMQCPINITIRVSIQYNEYHFPERISILFQFQLIQWARFSWIDTFPNFPRKPSNRNQYYWNIES